MSRRTHTIRLLVAAVLLCGLLSPVRAATASAAPRVTMHVRALPIPGFHGTGNILGAGAEIEMRYTIAGEEYAGSPSPLVLLTVQSPLGTRESEAPFATCAPSVLLERGAAGCPAQSRAGLKGTGTGVVTFGDERVPENVSIEPFFAPGDGLTFFTVGRTPAFFEVLEPGRWIAPSDGHGPEASAVLPLIETVPGGDDASILSFTVYIGAARRVGARTVSFITLPRTCPKRGYTVGSTLSFLSGERVTVATEQPCPPR
jgi:hypothetical protein